MRVPALLILAPIAIAAGGELAAAAAQDNPMNIIAAQIRDQGFQCDSPESAVQDMQASKADEAVWVLQCESGSYRVHLVPDMAAKVERLDTDKDTDKDKGNGANQ